MKAIIRQINQLLGVRKPLIPPLIVLILLASLLLWGGLPAISGDANGGNTSLSPGVILSAATGTNVSGTISSNTTWTKEESPYIVVYDITVPSGVTLTIQPGVVVKFQSGKSITIAGELIAKGIEAEPITFTSAREPTLKGDWKGILFANSAIDASYDEAGNYIAGCILEWCLVEYAGGGGNPAVEITNSSPFISQCTISQNSSSGISIEEDGSSPKIKACTISENSALYYGGGIYVYDGTVSLEASSISGNSADCGGGIYVRGGTVSIVASSISNNSANDGGGIYVKGGTVSLVHNNIIGNPQGSGIWLCVQPQELSYNNIYDNSPYDLRVDVAARIIATNNWWGTTDTAEINQKIYDYLDDSSLGLVTYTPFLTSPNLDAPPTPPSGLMVYPGVGTLTLSWQANPEADVTGYKVYYDIDSGTPYEGKGATEGDSPIDAGNVTSFTLSGLTIGQTYYIAITAYDSQGLESWFSEEVVGTVVMPEDTTPPTTPVVIDDGAYTTSLSHLHFSWSAGDPDTGIAEYQYALGTTLGGTEIIGWTSAATKTKVDLILPLEIGKSYFLSVKAKNGAGLWSEVGTSDGITVIPSIPSIQGKVLLEGRTNHSGAKVEVFDTSQNLVAEAISQADGSYAILGLEPGSYQLKVSMSGYLYAVHNFEASLFPELPLTFNTTLLGGDVDGNGIIGQADLEVVGNVFNTTNYNADINGDGIIDIYDLTLVGKNFNKTAPQG